MRDRLMAGLRALDPVIVVRFHGPQPFGGIVYRLGRLTFYQQSRVRFPVPLPLGGAV